MKRARPVGVLTAVVLLAACTVGPDYQRPSAPVPAQYKEAGWKVGEPLDAIDRGAWWSVYKDPLLDDLKKQIDNLQPELKAAEAAF
jgi:outer membrane protein TolC